jgi:hypothetical protein
MNILVRIGLGLAQVPAELIDELDAKLPGAGRLIAAAKALEPELQKLAPIVEKAVPIYDQVKPLVDEAMPIIKDVLPKVTATWPDLVALLPLAEKAIAFMDAKK